MVCCVTEFRVRMRMRKALQIYRSHTHTTPGQDLSHHPRSLSLSLSICRHTDNGIHQRNVNTPHQTHTQTHIHTMSTHAQVRARAPMVIYISARNGANSRTHLVQTPGGPLDELRKRNVHGIIFVCSRVRRGVLAVRVVGACVHPGWLARAGASLSFPSSGAAVAPSACAWRAGGFMQIDFNIIIIIQVDVYTRATIIGRLYM